MAFLLDGSAAELSSFFADAGVAAGGGAPNENPGIDAPPPFFFSVAPNENPLVLAAAVTVAALTESSFFSSPDAEALAPKVKPADEFAFVAGAGAAAAPKVNPPPDGAVGDLEDASSSRPLFGLAGVLAGVDVVPDPPAPKENPPLPKLLAPPPEADGADADGEAPPKVNPPAPMVALSLPPPTPFPSSRVRFDLAGVVAAPPKENPPLPILAPPPEGDAAGAGAVEDEVAPPKLKPPVPMLPFFSPLAPEPELEELAAAPLSSLPALGASHAKHFPASFGFFVMHTSHFHSPGLDLKRLPHPLAAGAGAGDAFVAAGVGLSFFNELGDFGVLSEPKASFPNLNAIGVSTLDEAAAPPGMKLNGAPPPDGVVALPANTASAFFIKRGVAIPAASLEASAIFDFFG
mmetsp:Transcript_205/g.396  ORF Transcript_205/g.396 Transcript_205/m.396 type:complete len:405 (+) Transcript_205:1062-2276(+)